jgi:gamma-glutamyltranspeptidase/glutathione hydrolase
MVACPEPLAAEVGAAILERGGNAVDAGVATAFAQTVVNPLLSSLAGCGQFLVYLAATGHTEVILASPVSGSKAVPGVYTPAADSMIPGVVGGGRRVEGDRNLRGHAASVIPTVVRGLEEVHRRHGRLSWSELIAPAVRLARDGFSVSPYLYRTWDPDRIHPMGVRPADKIAAEPEARAIFMPGGRFLRPGETLIQRDLARTLIRIAESGAQVFYDGEIAQMIGRDFEAHGGLFTTDDLRWAAPVVETPLRGTYRDYTLLTDRPPGLGLILLEILRVLEEIDLRSLGWNSSAYLDVVARAMQFAFADAARVLGASTSQDALQLLAPAHTDAVRTRVRAGEFAHGPAPAPSNGTTHLAAVDRDRNAVSWVHSSGSGSGVVTPGLGFMHNDHMIMFDPRPGRPGSLAPRTVPVHGGGPVIILRGDRPWLAIGSPAGALKTTAITQVLLSVVEFGLPLQAAVSAPRIHTQHEAGVVMVEPNFPSGLSKALARRGHRIVVSDYTARISAIMVAPDGTLGGGADPRGGGGLEWC